MWKGGRRDETSINIAAHGPLAKPLQAALEGKEGSLRALDYNGREVLAFYHPIPDLGWGIVSKMDIDKAQESFFSTGERFILLLLAVVGCIWLIFFKFARGLQRELNQTQLRLKLARSKAENANEAKSKFIANVSHEIRTPLAAILGFSEFLVKLDFGGRVTKYSQRIQENATHLKGIVDDLLDLSKVEAGQLEFEAVEFSLKEQIKTTLSTMKKQAQAKGIALTSLFDPLLPERVRLDSKRFNQIIFNLLGNAIKFTSSGSVQIKLMIAEVNLLQVEIADTGCGMDVEQQRRLFKPFSQGDRSISRKFGGTGLGLHLSRKLAEGMGGNLILKESYPDKGSTFLLTLPFEAADPKTNNWVEKPRPDTGTELVLSGNKVLVVEDSPDLQEICADILKDAGASVHCVDTGRKAIQLAAAGNFDLIFMDIQLPGMSGIEATRELRQGGYEGPIVALTAHALKNQKQNFEQMGFSDYVTKPYDWHDLIEKSQQFCQKKNIVVGDQ